MAFYSLGGWKDSLFGDPTCTAPKAIRFYTRAKAITSRWPDDEYQEPTARTCSSPPLPSTIRIRRYRRCADPIRAHRHASVHALRSSGRLSATGGKRAADAAPTARGRRGGHANTKHYTIAMIPTQRRRTRSGTSSGTARPRRRPRNKHHAEYSNSDDPTKQAQLITDAINSHVDGWRTTPTPARVPDDPEGQAGPDPRSCSTRRTPTTRNAARWSTWPGRDDRRRPRRASARRRGQENVLCAAPGPGQAQLEARAPA